MMGPRAEMTTVSYVLSVAITTLLIVGLISGMGTFVSNEQEQAARGELAVVGDRLAAKLVATNALAHDRGGLVYAEPAVPETVVNEGYRVSLRDWNNGTWLVLTTESPDVRVTTRVATTVPVTNSSASSTDLALWYDGTALQVGERQ